MHLHNAPLRKQAFDQYADKVNGPCHVPEHGGEGGVLPVVFQVARLGSTSLVGLVLTRWAGLPIYRQLSRTLGGERLSRAVILATFAVLCTCVS